MWRGFIRLPLFCLKQITADNFTDQRPQLQIVREEARCQPIDLGLIRRFKRSPQRVRKQFRHDRPREVFAPRTQQVRAQVVHTRESCRELLERAEPGHLASESETIPIGRLGTAQDVANLVVYLCTEDSAFISGATVDINGAALLL